MTTEPISQTGGQVLVAALKAVGVEKIFCVPGESYLAALDALIDSGIEVVVCRHEGGASFMAEAYGKLTGKMGVCFVTRGPGACNAAIGLHTAKQDSTPYLLLIGQVARADLGREAFQEVDYRQMFQPPIAKAVFEAEHAADLSVLVATAHELATGGRPGPVVISLPEDVLTEETDVVATTPRVLAPPQPSMAQMEELRRLLSRAERPMILLGGNTWQDADIQLLQKICLDLGLPVAVPFRRQDIFDNRHAAYAGVLGTTVDAGLLKAVQDSDLIIALGTRLGDIMTQGYTLFSPPKMTTAKLVHIYPDASELGRVWQPDLAIHADAAALVRHLPGLEMVAKPQWQARMEALHDAYMRWSTPRDTAKFNPDLDLFIAALMQRVPVDTIVTTDAGNFSGWPQRFWRYGRPNRLLAPTSGAMGYAVPAAVAASLAAPGRAVVGFAGDGGFLMTAQEIATARQHGATPLLLVFDNGMYGTIRMHQEKHYPGRVSGTDLASPDFAALARAYGAHAGVIATNEDIGGQIDAALMAIRDQHIPAVLHIKMDPEQMTTGQTLSAIRAAAQAEKKL